MRAGFIAAMSLVITQTATSAAQPERTRPRFIKETFGTKAVIGAGTSAAIGQARNAPHEWGQGVAGLGKRFASAFAKHVVKNGIQYSVAGIRHEELGYQPSGKQGFGPRLGHALASTVVTRKTTTGRRTVAAGEISGAVGSGLVSRLWQPASLHTLSSGFASGGITLGIDAGMNVAKEFWPKSHRPRRHE